MAHLPKLEPGDPCPEVPAWKQVLLLRPPTECRPYFPSTVDPESGVVTVSRTGYCVKCGAAHHDVDY